MANAGRSSAAASPREAAGLLLDVSVLLHKSWRSLSSGDRERLLGEVVGWATSIRRSFDDPAGREGPTEDDVRAQLASPSCDVHLQPIVWLPTREVVGVEALTRFDGWPPNLWFDRAWASGVGLEFDLAAVERVVRALDRIPTDVYVAINVAPLTLLSNDLIALLASVDHHQVVVELTEHEPIAEYAAFRERLRLLRDLGVRVAVDDAGAGHSSLQHIIQLAPDTIKLDRSITIDCDRDPVRRSLMTCLATFAAQTKTSLIAEGVETEEEASALLSYGVAFGQGYLFGRPCHAPSLVLSEDTGGWLVASST